MTPKARREQQHARESTTRTDTEAAIEEFRAGRTVHRPTVLTSARKTRKNAARCYGCDTSGFPLQVWEYGDVASGPSILCDACAATAERAFTAARRAAAPAAPRRGDVRPNRRNTR